MKNNEYVLENVKIVDVVNSKIIENKIVHVKDGIIDFTDNKDVKRIDCNNMYLMPGLINLHVHLFGSGRPSNTLNAKGNSQKNLMKIVKTKVGHIILDVLYKKSLKDTIKSGTTTVRAVGDLEYTDCKYRDLVKKGKFVGPTILASGYAITTPGGHADGAISISGKTKEELERLVEINKEHNVDLIKIMITSGIMDAKTDHVDLMMDLESSKIVVNKAHELGYKVAAHVESSEGVKVALLAGVDSIEHGSKLDDEMVELFKKNKSTLTLTYSPAIPYGVFSKEETHCTEVQERIAKSVSQNFIACGLDAKKYGIKFGLGTDASCPYAFHYAMWRELAYYIRYAKGTVAEAIKIATINNAEILGIDKKVGSIEEGKVADMFLVENNPFDDVRNLSNAKVVFKDGNIIKNTKIKKNNDLDLMLDKISL